MTDQYPSSAMTRDNHSKAIINTDIASLKKRKAHVQYMKEFTNAKNDIETLKNELLVIKQLLDKITKNKDTS